MFFQVEPPCREESGGKIRNGTQIDAKHFLIYAHLRKTFPTLILFVTVDLKDINKFLVFGLSFSCFRCFQLMIEIRSTLF